MQHVETVSSSHSDDNVTKYLQLSNYNVQLTPGAWSDTMDNLDMETFISWSPANVSCCYQFPLIL